MSTQSSPPAPLSFQFADLPLRVVMRDDEPWFVAADVCAALGLGNASLAVNGRADRKGADGLDEDERGVATVNTPSGNQEMLIVNESGLYSLIFKSRKAEAKRFKKWVTSEVLPTIRRTGRYQIPTDAIISPAQQRQIQEAIAARFPDGRHRPYAWSRFNGHFRLGSYKQLPAARLDEALAYIPAMPLSGDALTLEKARAAQAREALAMSRFLLSFTGTGQVTLCELPADAVCVSPSELPALVGDSMSGAVDRVLLPPIIEQAAKRLRA
jgi:prophage antirepressor-like protein